MVGSRRRTRKSRRRWWWWRRRRDETEEEDATEEQDPPPTAPSVPDDLNELLGNIAAQLTVEFEETVDTWHPAGKVTLPQLTLTACPGYGPP